MDNAYIYTYIYEMKEEYEVLYLNIILFNKNRSNTLET